MTSVLARHLRTRLAVFYAVAAQMLGEVALKSGLSPREIM
jgi:hypothetical protein